MNQPKSNRVVAIFVVAILGWLSLIVGIFLYIVPLFYDKFGHHSSLIAFGFVFVGITLLKYRKDQMNQ